MENKKLTTSLVAGLLLATNLYSNEVSSATVYSATKSNQSIKDVTSNIEVITKEEIEEKRFTNLTEALNSVPGLSFTANGGLGKVSSLRLNGMHYTDILILIDGIRYNDITNGSAFPEHILLSDVERVEIIKGAQSGIWGADASGGVINIITQDAKEGFSGSVNAEYGSFDTKRYGLGLSYKKDNYYVKLNAQRLTTDGFSSQATRGENIDKFEDDAYQNTTLSVKTGYSFDDSNKIDLSHRYIKSKSEYDTYNAPNSFAKTVSTSNFSQINYNHTNQYFQVDLYANKSTFDRKNHTTSTTHFEGDVKEYGLKSTFDYNEKDFFIFGIDRKVFKDDATYETDYTNNGVYLTNSNSFYNTVFTQSLRYDNYTDFDSKVTGKVGVKHFLGDFVLAANYGTGYRVPSLRELYTPFYGNPNLEPEFTRSYDASIAYKGLELRYFKNKIDDLIGYDPNTYVNEQISGTSVIKGYEINYKKDVLEDTILSLSYSNVSAKDEDNKTLGRVPKETLKASVDYYGIEKLHINVNAEYIGDRWDRNGEPANGKKTGRYTVWNSVVNYDINSDLKVYLKVDNIFDKYYQTVEGYASTPRSAYVGLNYKF